MDWGAVNDPVTSTSDVYVLPDYNVDGIYLLEDAEEPSERYTRERPLSRVRMRESQHRRSPTNQRPVKQPQTQESFTSESFGFRDYERNMPSQTLLRSSRRGRAPIEAAAWDNRPRGFRPDDGPAASAFIPPANVRPPGGGIITPWETSYAPSYSEAVMRDSVADPNMIGLAPCNVIPRNYGAAQKESFAAVGARRRKYEIMAIINIVLVIILIIVGMMLAIELRPVQPIVIVTPNSTS